MSGGYQARNGARDAPAHRQASSGSTLGDDFPMLCETCLGPNPYVRMTKMPFGTKLCKISSTPYQAFRWKAGPNGRYKETIICYAVAAERNICQTCLNDMKYGLPVGVRDALLKKNAESAGDGSGHQQIALPKSNVGQMYFYEQQAQLVESGLANPQNEYAMTLANAVPSRQLDKFSRSLHFAEAKSKSGAFRNLAKLCSFWVQGTCARVARKTCPFRPCCGVYAFPELASTHREMCDDLIKQLKDAEKNGGGPADVQRTLSKEVKMALLESQHGNRDDAIKKRVLGDDDLTKRYLGKMKSMNMSLTPPEDASIVTLWIGNLEPDISEQDLRGAIYAYGTIESIHMIRPARCAFVEYADRATAEHAAAQLHKALVVNGKALTVNWAKPRSEPIDAVSGGAGGSRASATSSYLPPPPGMENMDESKYSLLGMPKPLTVWDSSTGGGAAPLPPPRPANPPPTPTFNANDIAAVGAVRPREDGGDAEEGVKRQRPPPPPSIPRPPPPANRGKTHTPTATVLYPSMNPARMGAPSTR